MRIDGDVLGAVVRTVDPVADVGEWGQRLEAVQESGRDVQMPKSTVVQKESLLHPESRRLPSDVDQYVVNRPACAPDEFGFTAARSAVHASQHPLSRARLGVLHKSRRFTGTHMLVEHLRVEGPREEAAVVAVGFVDEQQYIGEACRLDPHRVIVT